MGLRILGLLCRILLPLESSRLVALFRWDCFWYFGFIWDQGFLGLFHIFLLVGFAGKWVFLWFQFIYILLSWDWLKVAFKKKKFAVFLCFSYLVCVSFACWFWWEMSVFEVSLFCRWACLWYWVCVCVGFDLFACWVCGKWVFFLRFQFIYIVLAWDWRQFKKN